MKEGATTALGGINASGNGTLPIVETDEEHNIKGVNIKTNRIVS